MDEDLFTTDDSPAGGCWVDLVAAQDIAPGDATTVVAHDRALAVCNDGGRFFVVDNTCPHAGGSLGAGYVRDGHVICPWHHWPFNLNTGKTGDDWAMGVAVYPVRVRNGRVWAFIAADRGERLAPDETDLQTGK
ncbi:MAG: 3-phenylpropionate/cinnamic acid dioxygenase ferredoxin subunit [Phycisphaerae bacterium]|nr:3-phenylpropionate/cinnamic acid dioxygenase ferredoxin subunit [Phycisphaerae bacterium]